jgi:F-type H+-transporting ATPase subunit a
MELVRELPKISMAAETLFHIGPLPVTNSLFTTWITIALMILFAWLATRRMSLVPTGLQNLVETAIEMFYNGVARVRAPRRARLFLPLSGSIFFFILVENWMGLLPFFGSVGLLMEHHGESEFVPILRPANTDLNTTLAVAIFSVVATQIYGIKERGFLRYFNRFIRVGGIVDVLKGRRSRNPLMLIIDLFIGFLEILDELTKLLSFSFRLFGNIFAGEVLLIVISMLLPYFAPLPFLALELFVGYIQALIFATLSLVFVRHACSEEDHC